MDEKSTPESARNGRNDASLVKWMLGIATLFVLGMVSMGVTNHARLAALENERAWMKEDMREMKALLRRIEERLRVFELKK